MVKLNDTVRYHSVIPGAGGIWDATIEAIEGFGAGHMPLTLMVRVPACHRVRRGSEEGFDVVRCSDVPHISSGEVPCWEETPQ